MQKNPQKTAQRLAIYNFIKDNKSHPRIKDIYEHVCDQLSNISMTTVYNTMEHLKQRGVVQELPVAIPGGGKRFDSNPKPHDHLICTHCGSVFDIEVDIDHSLLVHDDQRRGFEISEISINIFGRCSDCGNKKSEQDTLS